jgi:hypothetical protein
MTAHIQFVFAGTTSDMPVIARYEAIAKTGMDCFGLPVLAVASSFLLAMTGRGDGGTRGYVFIFLLLLGAHTQVRPCIETIVHYPLSIIF